MEIDLAIMNEYDDFKDDYEDIYRKIIEKACHLLKIDDDLELSVIFVDDKKIH